jgi:2'-5' RNA ligase
VGQADWHVTLCFLGPVEQSAVEPMMVRAALVQAATFTLRFDRIERWREARVLVATASQVPAEARDLVQALHGAAQELGLKPDQKPWRPHLTLARSARTARAMPAALDEERLPTALAMPVSRFHLAESRRDGPRRYTSLGSWPLQLRGA